MVRVFRFNDEDDFNSQRSTEFAFLLRQTPDSVRDKLFETYGISLRTKKSPLLTGYDGRKVGFGSFVLDGEEIHFVISPKTNTLRLKTLFQALEGEVDSNRVRFSHVVSSAPAEAGQDDFTFAFLLRLLDEIASSSTYLLNTTYKKREVLVKGGIKGRPLLAQSFKRFALGKEFGIICQMLDDESLRDYAVVLLHTARSVSTLLDEWHDLTGQKHHEGMKKINFVTSRITSRAGATFNRSLLYKVCRPPFPYGLRDVLYKCMRYWQWQGAFRLTEGGLSTSGYWGVVIDLDLIFQSYVGHTWNKSLQASFGWDESATFRYYVQDQSKPRKLILDHVFFDHDKRLMLVVDAKYSEHLASEDQIYQILAYLSYDYGTDFTYDHKIGVLVYPGDDWKTFKVSGFERDLYCVQMPISSELYHGQVFDFVQNLLILLRQNQDLPSALREQ